MANTAWVAPENIDPECKALCEALNRLPGIETSESCCGHGKYPYRVWLHVRDYAGRGFLTLSRLMSRNYYSTPFKIILDHSDMAYFLDGTKHDGPSICFMLEAEQNVGAHCYLDVLKVDDCGTADGHRFIVTEVHKADSTVSPSVYHVLFENGLLQEYRHPEAIKVIYLGKGLCKTTHTIHWPPTVVHR